MFNIPSDSIECNHPSRNISSLFIPKVVRLKTGEVLFEKEYMSPRPPPKISLRHDWARGEVPLGSTVDQQSEGEVVRRSEEVSRRANFFQQIQLFTKNSVLQIDQGNVISRKMCSVFKHVRLEKTRMSMLSRLMIDQGNLTNTTLQYKTHPEVYRERVEEDMDFKIPGLPYSIVNQLKSANVRELIQKIENHPNRYALQRDLQKSQSLNPFSQESKHMIHEVGNIELCELLDTEPKTQCKECLSYWDIGIVCCTCGHFLRKGTEENKKFTNYTMDLSVPDYYTKKGRLDGHCDGKKPGDQEYYIALQLKKKCKKVLPGDPRSIHTR